MLLLLLINMETKMVWFCITKKTIQKIIDSKEGLKYPLLQGKSQYYEERKSECRLYGLKKKYTRILSER